MFTAREIIYYSVPQHSLVNSVLQITEFNVYLILSKFTIMSSMSEAHMCMLQDEEENKVSRLAFRFICFGSIPKLDNLKRK